MEQAFPTTFRTYHVQPSTTARTVVYTVPENHTAYVRALFLANTTNSTVDTQIEWYDSSEATYNILYKVDAAGKTTKSEYDTILFVLEAGDQLTAKLATASSIDVVVTVGEFFDPARN